MSLKGRCALVTGGSRGVGRGIALALAGAGADVAIVYRREVAAAQETLAQVQALGRRAFAFQADVADPQRAKEVAELAIQTLGHVDILANNAGIASRGNPIIATELAEFHRVINTHAFGALHFTQALLPEMRRHPRGDILFISSAATLHYGANGAPYNMAKAAMEALAKTLAKEERHNGIRVNVVAPGLVETEMGRRLVRATRGIQDIKHLYPDSPFGRVAQPRDIGNLCAFLCSPEAEYITGQVIYVHGGESGPAREG